MELTDLKNKKNRKKNYQPLDVYGKVPPQSREAEEAVIGACINQPQAINEVADILKPEAFYVDAHQRIFKAFLNMLHKSIKVDIVTLVEELKFSEDLETIGGPYKITELSKKISSSAHIRQHAKIIKDKFLLRELIRVGGDAVAEGYEDSTEPSELLKQISTDIYRLQSGSFKKDLEGMESIVFNALVRINEGMANENKGISGIASGFVDLDSITGGWQKSDLIILAARPSVGKTAFSLMLAKNAAKNGVGVAFFSLEMSTGQIIQRIFSEESEIPLDSITKKKLTPEQFESLYKEMGPNLSKRKLYFDDTSSINPVELRAKVRRAIEKFGVGLVIIDYLQLMSPADPTPGKNKNDSIGDISRDLKGIAKDFEIPIIALSQLSREVEKRTTGVPTLSDLRDSGAIEQDADVVLFLYNKDGVRHLDCAKHRNGALGKIKLSANLTIQRFTDYDSSYTSAVTGKKVVPLSEKLEIQKGSKIKSEDFDEGYNIDEPFS